MDIFADYTNPVGYDQRLIMDKLGYDTPSTVEKSNNVNDRLRLALLEHELAESRRKLQEVDVSKKQATRETFVSGGSCGCGSAEGMKSKPRQTYQELEDGETIMGLSMKKFMIILVIIMAAFCVIQYFSHQSEMREIMSAMCLMLKNNSMLQPSTQSAGTTQPSAQSGVQQVTTTTAQ